MRVEPSTRYHGLLSWTWASASVERSDNQALHVPPRPAVDADALQKESADGSMTAVALYVAFVTNTRFTAIKGVGAELGPPEFCEVTNVPLVQFAIAMAKRIAICFSKRFI